MSPVAVLFSKRKFPSIPSIYMMSWLGFWDDEVWSCDIVLLYLLGDEVWDANVIREFQGPGFII